MNTRPRSTRARSTLRLAVPLALLALAACTDRDIAGPRALPDPGAIPSSGLQALTCTGSLGQRTVSCATARTDGGRATIIGGQNVNVKLTSSNVSYTPVDSIFQFDVTVQNLLPEKMGTRDGVTLDSAGIRVFFADGPAATSGSGNIALVNADDAGTFTGTGQLFFQYDTVLATNQVSHSRTWQLRADPTVGTFTFTVYVAAALQPLIVITELMANPGGTVQDSSGEYVEVYNAGRFPVNMKGMIVNDQSGSGVGGTDTIPTDFIVPSGAYRVMGRSTNTSKNGGITVHYNYVQKLGGISTLLQFSNSAADHFRIRTATGVTVDSAGYTNAGTAAVAGRARELTNVALDNRTIDGASWAQATTNYESANRGTPGAVNSTSTTLPPPGQPATVTLLPTSVQLAPGGTVQMSVSAVDSLGQPTSTTFTWTTLASAVATVNSSGLVTAGSAGTTSVIATAANGRADTATVIVQAVEYLDHVEFGTPSDGTPNNEIILVKTQYVTSYGPNRGGPNWVAWNLNQTHFGASDRCDCFMADTTLPDSVYLVVTSDYTGSGYSRGHMVMSAQRTATDTDNAATFLMTNILPQHQDQNGGPWLRFENFNNELAEDSVKELYIIAGGTYPASPATLNGAGKVQLPSTHWKIVVILARGQTLADVGSTADIRVIAVNMPNVAGISGNGWEMYKTTVDAIEAATGYDFLADLPDAIEAAVEAAIGS
jgi:DNA/RNA endonuclease G (NUC1)